MNGGWIQYAAFGLNGRNLRMEKVFQNYDLKQWQSWLLEQYRNENGNGMLEGRVCRIVEMFLNPEMERYRKSAEQPVLPEAGYERLRCLTCYAVCIRTVFSELATSAKSPAELAAAEPEPLYHAGYKLWKTQAERDLFPDDARLVAAVLGPYPFNAREDIQATMMRIAFLSSEKAIKFVTPDLDLELQSLMLYFTRALSGDCVLTSLNYNELSALGLVYKINKEVLHRLVWRCITMWTTEFRKECTSHLTASTSTRTRPPARKRRNCTGFCRTGTGHWISWNWKKQE